MEATSNIPVNFYCIFCDYGCSKKSCWTQHTATSKHTKATNGLHSATKKYACEKCHTNFKHHSSYYRHKKNCVIDKNNSINESNNILDKDLIIMLVKQNTELIEQNTELMDMLKNNTTTQANHNTNSLNNNNNKTFNLQFFLNETCKNAMNITDFIDSIKLQISDLMEIGEIGYVEGISKIIVKNLNNLDETIRPVHCTDKKRETMYIKDEGEWNKEDEKKTKLKKAVTKVADKNIKLLPLFREKYPDYKNSSSKTSDKYDKMVLEVMTCDDDKNEKIITNISKITTIKE